MLYLLEAFSEARAGNINPTAALGAFKQLPTSAAAGAQAAGAAAASAPGVGAAIAATLGKALPTQPAAPEIEAGLKEVLKQAQDAGAHVMRRALRGV